MKTNVIMTRNMGDFDINQRTVDGYFNATELLKQWNDKLGMKKEIADFFKMDQTRDFIDILINEELTNTGKSPYLATRGNKGGTWMHPVLFIKFAMWINPKFEYYVIRFVYDHLIAFRHAAGDNYRGLTAAVQRLENVDYSKLAKALNYVIFGRHDQGLRQTASEKELNDLTTVENQLAFAVDMGYIKTFEELMNELRRIYSYRNLKIA